MPLYEFQCKECGVFDVWRSLAESSDPANCPTCEEPGRRLFSPPALLSGSLRLKRENPEPQLVKRESEQIAARARQHSGSRPWMIGH
ncbi:zinc ribbon domain-containing protein [Phormidium sp. CLA17]|uniref:FmdB family zinc ribbon protein n=1 Tax=Leptolyngbya sp. Cla-17 TaxID=2803751 RepID=UPI001492642A|nr:zinc ribbon domain-containing protein [Leptolyngbya sp. Cla-17]MBM0744025.1 zinc ribbon domain-containing protein [Leptolyngbya sp. Cla-17]